MSRKKKLIIVGLAATVVIAVGIGAYVSFGHSGERPLSIAKLKAQGDSVFGQVVQVEGEVESTSIQWDGQEQVLRFALQDGEESLDVIYLGVAPDSFEPGANVVLQGMYTQSGPFEAESIASGESVLCSVCH
ncbi:MAG: cytochrome c maturation protein CcmE [Dehalococcoidia bacterium]